MISEGDVVEIYSIGFTQKTAAQFFGLLKKAGIKRLMDVRLNNISQLAGFAKRDDLAFFLREIVDVDYVHEKLLAPTQAMLDGYKKQQGDWTEYEHVFLDLMAARGVEKLLDRKSFDVPTALLCSEPTADRCHRRLVLEYLGRHWRGVIPVHL